MSPEIALVPNNQGLNHLPKTVLNTVDLQWLKHILKHENMLETGVVRDNECESKGQIRRHNMDIFAIFCNMKVFYVFSLESPH